MIIPRKRDESPLTLLTGSSQESGAADVEAIFQQYWTRVCAVIYRLVGDRAEAEDLAQETFWRFYQRPPAERDHLGGWLYQVGTRLGYNALRGRKRRRQYEEQAGLSGMEAYAPPDPQVEAEQRQRRAQVRSALAQCKPRSAQLLILRSSGLTYAEIAAALDIAPGSVGTLLARAEREFERQYSEGNENDAPE